MTTERKMSPKGFLYKSNAKGLSAIAFLKAHREWLETGTLASLTSPILAKLDAGEVMPTPALELLRNAVLSHHIASEIAKGESAMAKAQEPKKTKNYLATILDGEGNIATRINAKGEVEDLQQSFDLPQEASRWCDRRLYDGASDWRGEVTSTKLHGSDGLPMVEHIARIDSIARILKKPAQPVVHVKGVSSKSLGFGVKAKQTPNVRSNMG